MKTKQVMTLFLLLFLFLACSRTEQHATAIYEVVPLPHIINYHPEEAPFVLDHTSIITYPSGNEELEKSAVFLSDYIRLSTHIHVKNMPDYAGENAIILVPGNPAQHEPSGAYRIHVSGSRIEITAPETCGLFYAIQTFRKALPVGKFTHISCPAVTINDWPGFQHRGVSLDVCRHFFPVEFVKKYIDVLALFNMNVFHWHLTDDQGWRIEIKKYPELTTIGSQRGGTALDRHSEEYDDVPYGGFYTQEQIREVIAYAAERYITVIPEIDIPGHTLAVLAAYPHLGCTGGPYDVAQGWGIFEDVLCAGNDSIFTFLDEVFTEVAALFPAGYIHIGGDECLKTRWKACPKCQQRIRDLGIRSLYAHTPEEQLQSYVIKRVEEMVNRKGKKIIGWDEILEGGIAPNATIMSWRGTAGGIHAASEGHDVIMTPEAYVYLDYYQSPHVDKEPYTFGWLTDLAKTYSFDPLPAGLPEDKRHHVLGGQVNIWTEYMATSGHVEYMLLPRMAAFAETLWRGTAGNNYNDFVDRMYKQSLLLDQLGYENCKEPYDIQLAYRQDTLQHTIGLSLSTFDNSPVYYTLDGSNPDENSLQYSGPLVIDRSCVVHAVTYRNEQPGKILTKTFSINKATACPVTLAYAPDPRYTFNGASTLVDGQAGYKESYRTGTWIGFLAGPMDAVIRLRDNTTFHKVSFNTFVNTRGSLFPPVSLTVQVSDDGKEYRTVYNEKFPAVTEHVTPRVITINAIFDEQTANYVKIVAENTGRLPLWHEREGYTHLMVGELVVE